ncbi:MAG: NADH-quinone oxidoreductase subunit NuoE [Propionibacterium sp.]|nr:NADH-quinone oxidoreductase subunit NuoE [Propionibacterium sp.]
MNELAELAARYPQPRSALLPMLHLVQSAQGRITPAGIEACADTLGITAAEVNGVATFYTMFKRNPVGKHHIGVCVTALCAIMGGDAIAEKVEDYLGVGHNETTADGAFTYERVECNAACDYAPVVMVNWEFFDTMNPDSTIELIDKLRAGEEVASTRGATITSWREAERVIAGFPDGRADEGPSAGLQSQLGLKLAKRHGWQAPAADAAAPRKEEQQ